MNQRIKKLYLVLGQQGLDGLIICLPSNITYLTKYTSRDSYLLVSKKQNVYFTDSRYIEEARLGLKGLAQLRKINGSFFKIISDTCLDLRLKRIGFEERYLAYAEYKKIGGGLGKKADLIPTHSLIEELRQVKDQQEIEKIRRAILITGQALRFIKDFISPGKKEIEIEAELERFIRYQGAGSSAFAIIIASGTNSSFPHHISSQKRIQKDDLVLIDIGVDYQGYKSDLTRVFFLGKIKVLARQIYDIARKAQEKTIKKIKPGIKALEIDRIGRQYIHESGFGKYFGHNLGHGVGLEVHEYPHISGQDDTVLEQGMIFTVEPGIYLPNKFGVRIEDMILVTKKGCEVLSGFVNK